MMNCTQCGAPLERDAKFCGRCGKAVAGGTAAMDPKKAQGLGCLGVIGAVALIAIFQNDGSPSAESKEVKAAAIDPAPCEKALGGLEQAGLIKDRPDANRVDVEEDLWAVLPAKQKRLAAAAVRCSFLKGDIGRTDFNSYAVVYGYRSGKRLAMATGSGVTIE